MDKDKQVRSRGRPRKLIAEERRRRRSQAKILPSRPLPSTSLKSPEFTMPDIQGDKRELSEDAARRKSRRQEKLSEKRKRSVSTDTDTSSHTPTEGVKSVQAVKRLTRSRDQSPALESPSPEPAILSPKLSIRLSRKESIESRAINLEALPKLHDPKISRSSSRPNSKPFTESELSRARQRNRIRHLARTSPIKSRQNKFRKKSANKSPQLPTSHDTSPVVDLTSIKYTAHILTTVRSESVFLDITQRKTIASNKPQLYGTDQRNRSPKPTKEDFGLQDISSSHVDEHLTGSITDQSNQSNTHEKATDKLKLLEHLSDSKKPGSQQTVPVKFPDEFEWTSDSDREICPSLKSDNTTSATTLIDGSIIHLPEILTDGDTESSKNHSQKQADTGLKNCETKKKLTKSLKELTPSLKELTPSLKKSTGHLRRRGRPRGKVSVSARWDVETTNVENVHILLKSKGSNLQVTPHGENFPGLITKKSTRIAEVVKKGSRKTAPSITINDTPNVFMKEVSVDPSIQSIIKPIYKCTVDIVSGRVGIDAKQNTDPIAVKRNTPRLEKPSKDLPAQSWEQEFPITEGDKNPSKTTHPQSEISAALKSGLPSPTAVQEKNQYSCHTTNATSGGTSNDMVVTGVEDVAAQEAFLVNKKIDSSEPDNGCSDPKIKKSEMTLDSSLDTVNANANEINTCTGFDPSVSMASEKVKSNMQPEHRDLEEKEKTSMKAVESLLDTTKNTCRDISTGVDVNPALVMISSKPQAPAQLPPGLEAAKSNIKPSIIQEPVIEPLIPCDEKGQSMTCHDERTTENPQSLSSTVLDQPISTTTTNTLQTKTATSVNMSPIQYNLILPPSTSPSQIIIAKSSLNKGPIIERIVQLKGKPLVNPAKISQNAIVHQFRIPVPSNTLNTNTTNSVGDEHSPSVSKNLPISKPVRKPTAKKSKQSFDDYDFLPLKEKKESHRKCHLVARDLLVSLSDSSSSSSQTVSPARSVSSSTESGIQELNSKSDSTVSSIPQSNIPFKNKDDSASESGRLCAALWNGRHGDTGTILEQPEDSSVNQDIPSFTSSIAGKERSRHSPITDSKGPEAVEKPAISQCPEVIDLSQLSDSSTATSEILSDDESRTMETESSDQNATITETTAVETENIPITETTAVETENKPVDSITLTKVTSNISTSETFHKKLNHHHDDGTTKEKETITTSSLILPPVEDSDGKETSGPSSFHSEEGSISFSPCATTPDSPQFPPDTPEITATEELIEPNIEQDPASGMKNGPPLPATISADEQDVASSDGNDPTTVANSASRVRPEVCACDTTTSVEEEHHQINNGPEASTLSINQETLPEASKSTVPTEAERRRESKRMHCKSIVNLRWKMRAKRKDIRKKVAVVRSQKILTRRCQQKQSVQDTKAKNELSKPLQLNTQLLPVYNAPPEDTPEVAEETAKQPQMLFDEDFPSECEEQDPWPDPASSPNTDNSDKSRLSAPSSPQTEPSLQIDFVNHQKEDPNYSGETIDYVDIRSDNHRSEASASTSRISMPGRLDSSISENSGELISASEESAIDLLAEPIDKNKNAKKPNRDSASSIIDYTSPHHNSGTSLIAQTYQGAKKLLESARPTTRYQNIPSGLSFPQQQGIIKPCEPRVCTCTLIPEEPTLQQKKVKPIYCGAVEDIEGKSVTCLTKVSNSMKYKSANHLPSITLCKTHRKKLSSHSSCPTCGLFCISGDYLDCREGAGHHHHKTCAYTSDNDEPLCPHCNEKSEQISISLKPWSIKLQKKSTKTRQFDTARITRPLLHTSPSEQPESQAIEQKIFDTNKFISLDMNERTKLITTISDLEHLKPVMKAKLESVTKRSRSQLLYDLSSVVIKNDINQILLCICDLLAHERSNLTNSDSTNPDESKTSILDTPYLQINNQTALHLAVSYQSIAAAHCLITAGAGINCFDKKMTTPLILACKNGNLDLVKYLIAAGAMTDLRDIDGMTGLHIAAVEGHASICDFLTVNNYAYINCADEGGWTPLVWAIERLHLTTVQCLLRHGANIHQLDLEGNTAIHWAAYSGSPDILKLLLDRKANIETINNHGDRPLHIAVRQARTDAVILLMSRGADTSVINNEHETPAECCLGQGSVSDFIKEFLSVNSLLISARISNKPVSSRLLHQDLSRGREKCPIPVVNEIDDTNYPEDFTYVSENVYTSIIIQNNLISSLNRCKCDSDCTRSICECARSSVQCWYTSEGLLNADFDYFRPPIIFECNQACRCWTNCSNRLVQNGISAHLEIFKTAHRGWGVRCSHDLPRGSFVCEYIGEMITDSQADDRPNDQYLFDLDSKDSDTYCIDACLYGNVARFINHRCNPNLVPVSVFIEHHDLRFPRISLFTNMDVPAGTELGFDYGEKFWLVKYKEFLCDCHGSNCKYNVENINQTLQIAGISPTKL